MIRRLAAGALGVLLLAPMAGGPGSTVRAAGPSEGEAVRLEGTLRIAVADDFAHGRTELRYALETAGGRRTLAIRPGIRPTPAAAGATVRIEGTRLRDGRIRVTSLASIDRTTTDRAGTSPDAPLTGSLAAPVAAGAAYGWAGPTVRKVAVVIGTYSDPTSAPGTADGAQAAMTGAGGSVRSFFETASRGRASVDATVFGPWDLGIDSCPAGTAFDRSIDAVKARAAASGINLATFDHVLIWTRAPCGTNWTALGEIAGQFVHTSAPYPDDGGRTNELANVAAHELGHNMGLLHANGLACVNGVGVAVALSATCTAVAYGDPFSTMGGNQGWIDPADGHYRFLSPLFDAAELAHLGWLDPSEEQTVTAAGTYHLSSTYGDDAGVRLLRIRRPTPPVATDPSMGWDLRGGWLTVELRSEPPSGAFDAWGVGSEIRTGVVVRYVEAPWDYTGLGYVPALGSTYMVDGSPETKGTTMADADFHDAPIEVGETVSDPVGKGAQVTLTALDATGATLTIAFPNGVPAQPADLAAPTVTSVTAASGQATVTWNAPSTSGTSPVDGYTVRSYPGGLTCVTFEGDTHGCTVTGLANGTTYRFTVTSGDLNGDWRMSLPSDPVTPVGPPEAWLLPLPAWRASQAVDVAWTGTDDGQPVDSFDVQVRSAAWNGGFGGWTPWLDAVPGTTGTYAGAPGRTYCFEARATRDATTGPWSAERCTVVPLDDRSLKAGSGWSAITGSAYYRSTALKGSASGAALVRKGVQARRIALLVSTCPTCGSLKVYWNGTLKKTVRLTSGTSANQVLVSVLSFSSVKSGTLKLVIGTSGKRVVVDGVAISRS